MRAKLEAATQVKVVRIGLGFVVVQTDQGTNDEIKLCPGDVLTVSHTLALE